MPLIKMLAIATFIFVLSACASAEDARCLVSPKIFCEPFQALKSEMPAEEQQKLLALKSGELWETHFGLGMGVRNQFGLWHDNELTRFFKQNGVSHPDGMSAPFIAGFAQYLRGDEVDMVKVISSIPSEPPPPPLTKQRHN